MADLFKKTKNTKYHTVKTVTKTNRKNVETHANSIFITHMYMTTILLLGAVTVIKSDGVKLVCSNQ
jgi:hypothetical protein